MGCVHSKGGDSQKHATSSSSPPSSSSYDRQESGPQDQNHEGGTSSLLPPSSPPSSPRLPSTAAVAAAPPASPRRSSTHAHTQAQAPAAVTSPRSLPLASVSSSTTTTKKLTKRTLPSPFQTRLSSDFPQDALTLPQRPATNPLPTSHHSILLNVDKSGGGTSTSSPSSSSPASTSASPTSTLKKAHSQSSADVCTSNRRRPRPLAIPADSTYNLSTVLGHLVIGGDEVSDNLTVLKQLNVKAVVNTTTEGGEMLGDLHYMKLNWTDDITQKILPDFDRCFAYIDDAKAQGGICLVHCKKGMSRSGAVVIGYLMYSKQMSLLEALTYARSRRAIIAPNLGFMEQLLEYEMKHQGRITVDLEKYQENRFGDTSILLCGA